VGGMFYSHPMILRFIVYRSLYQFMGFDNVDLGTGLVSHVDYGALGK